MFSERYENIPLCLPGFESINRYWDKRHNSIAAKILPGEFYVTKKDEIIVTVLGSCVSACICDPVSGIGGMNHFMLPVNGTHTAAFNSASTRYGNFAMEHLINEVMKNGGVRRRLQVKLFGGGRVLQTLTDVGKQNIEFVLNYVAEERLALISKDLGDTCPRKVIYMPKTGKVLLKRLASMHNKTIINREEEYIHNVEEEVLRPGEVDLF